MTIEKNISLAAFNTFGIDVQARSFAKFENKDDLSEAFSEVKNESTLILGGGSNILFTKDYDGLVLKNEIKGIKQSSEDEDHVWLKIGAGENWHQTVLHCIEKGHAGVENLSLIPGNCGAAPMQNIGAYGMEIKEVFQELEAFHISSGEIHTFSKKDCNFGYRESVFKNKLKGEYVILNITLRLNKRPIFNVSYGAIQDQLESMHVASLSIKAISDAVIHIRQSKLPDPKDIGNAGSFFKNPVVSKEELSNIQRDFPEVVHYPLSDGKIKLAAGWLIDQAGWKGKTIGKYGVHKDQALVLVNYGKAKGKEIYDLSEKIQISVKEKYSVDLEREVNIV